MPGLARGPILARKRLATALRDLRQQHGYTLEHVAGELLISVSKLSRLENAQGLPQLRDVRDLAAFYGLSGTAEAESLLRWVRDGRQKGWWTDFEDVFTPDVNEFIGYENEATVSLQVGLTIIPGILQSPAYARAVITNMRAQWSDHEIDRAAQSREIRQRNLHGRDGLAPLELKVILHEDCLHQSIGSVDALREQLLALQEFAKFDNIDLRVFPFSATVHPAVTMMWQHFSFGDEVDRDVAFMETAVGLRYVEDETTVRRFERWFAELVRRSLDPVQSVARIQDALSTLLRG